MIQNLPIFWNKKTQNKDNHWLLKMMWYKKNLFQKYGKFGSVFH